MKMSPGKARALVFTVLALLGAVRASADPAGADVSTTTQVPSRLFWVIPNYATVEERRAIVPLAARDKWALAARDSFDPFAFPVAGVYAGIAYARNENEEWGRGGGALAKYYGAAFADQTVSNFMTEGAFPVLLHEDPRYFRLGRGGFWRRTGYALSRVFMIRTDRGETEFNFSEFGGNGVMALAGNAYYPNDERTVAATADRWGVQIGLDMVFNVAKEFWPDVRRALTGH